MSSRALLLINRHARQGQKGLSEAIQYLKTLGFDLIEESGRVYVLFKVKK